MGRILGFLAEVLATVRALAELAAVFGRPIGRPKREGVNGGEPDAAPAPLVLAQMDGPAGEPLREPGGPAPSGSLTEDSRGEGFPERDNS